MEKWQENRKITLQQEMQHAQTSPNSSRNTDVELEEQWMLQIGHLLNLVNCFTQYATLRELAAQYSLDTPVTAEALSFALWVMASHITSMFDQLKISTFTWNLSLSTLQKRDMIIESGQSLEEMFHEMCLEIFGETPNSQ